MQEFELIQHYFQTAQTTHPDVILGIGDDAAICQLSTGKQLVAAVDTLNKGIHFPINTSAADIAYKALAVNLSDFAAMAAIPKWMTLALSLPSINAVWIQQFSQSLFELAHKHQISLIGGDTTQGELSISIQLLGEISPNSALRRDQAQIGDDIYVTGTLGDAGLGLASLEKNTGLSPTQLHFVQSRLNRPTARLDISPHLIGVAHSCIDISDGLLADLGHITTASHLGACLFIEKLPLSAALKSLKPPKAWQLALSAGDDYELCFTAPANQRAFLNKFSDIHQIGTIEAQTGIRCLQSNGNHWHNPQQGYEHFNTPR